LTGDPNQMSGAFAFTENGNPDIGNIDNRGPTKSNPIK